MEAAKDVLTEVGASLLWYNRIRPRSRRASWEALSPENLSFKENKSAKA
jgi:hypothetical protein